MNLQTTINFQPRQQRRHSPVILRAFSLLLLIITFSSNFSTTWFSSNVHRESPSSSSQHASSGTIPSSWRWTSVDTSSFAIGVQAFSANQLGVSKHAHVHKEILPPSPLSSTKFNLICTTHASCSSKRRTPSFLPRGASSCFTNTNISTAASTTQLSLMGTGAASILAGSIGGAIGVGVAYPLDTLKTKAQVLAGARQKQQKEQGQHEQQQQQQHSLELFHEEIEQQQLQAEQQLTLQGVRKKQLQKVENDSTQSGQVLLAEPPTKTAITDKELNGVHHHHHELPPPGSVHVHTKNLHSQTDLQTVPIESPEEDLISLVKLILEMEGIAGFFGGVKAMMIGQALIKSVAFSANEMALGVLNGVDSGVIDAATAGGDATDVSSSFVTLLLAASFSGFVTSFLVAPVERVKVMMQAQQNSLYANELECIQAVLKNEGWGGLFSRGLGPTLAREVPSYGIYFVVYGLLMQTSMAEALGGAAPLVFGAASGCACWIPVYPVDVVKTLVQNTEGGDSSTSAIDVAIQLYNDEGIGAFFNGLTPKMLRASVNHAVTFWVYDLLMGVLV